MIYVGRRDAVSLLLSSSVFELLRDPTFELYHIQYLARNQPVSRNVND